MRSSASRENVEKLVSRDVCFSCICAVRRASPIRSFIRPQCRAIRLRCCMGSPRKWCPHVAVLSNQVVCKDGIKQLVCPARGSAYRALSSESAVAYGLSPAFVVHDELGLVRGPRSELFEALQELDSIAGSATLARRGGMSRGRQLRRPKRESPGYEDWGDAAGWAD